MLVGSPAAPEIVLTDPWGAPQVAGPLVYPTAGTNQPTAPYVDVSLLNSDGQYNALVALLEEDDADQPTQFTGTPPWTEGIDPDEVIPEYVIDQAYHPPADVEAQATQDLQQRVRDAYEPFVSRPWNEPDDQYGGLGVPPGPPNLNQPIELGPTQIVRNVPGASHGDMAWSGAPALARVARMFNGFPSYNAGTSRGHGIAPGRTTRPLVYFTQQYRDLLLAELKKRGVHNVVIDDVPSVPYTYQVQSVDPTTLAYEPVIGAEGVLPW